MVGWEKNEENISGDNKNGKGRNNKRTYSYIPTFYKQSAV